MLQHFVSSIAQNKSWQNVDINKISPIKTSLEHFIVGQIYAILKENLKNIKKINEKNRCKQNDIFVHQYYASISEYKNN